MLAILCEKKTAAQNMSKALGGVKSTYNGEDYVIVSSSGHIYEYVKPVDQITDENLREKYRVWSLKNIPWDFRDFSWARVSSQYGQRVADSIVPTLENCDEIVIATDFDPTGEGFLLAYEILKENDLLDKPMSRMIFSDETPKSLQSAFKERKQVRDVDTYSELSKSLFRSKWDFISMQWTRIATICSGANTPIVEGRLKSVINQMVGAYWKAIEDYKPTTNYQLRFKDEHERIYTDPKQDVVANRSDIDITAFNSSSVSVKETKQKSVQPPKLIDMAMLAANLAKMGFSSSQVKDTYQQMYQVQAWVSYPRTEDHQVTQAQFDELSPYVDLIARLVGVNPSDLPVRQSRPTHIAESLSHGANRPTTNVPKSLAEIEAVYGKCGVAIYKEVALSYLAMFADDYKYTQHKCIVDKYPTFMCDVNTEDSKGWVKVLDEVPVALDDKPLGTQADPTVYEMKSKKPPKPTVKRIMNDLSRYNVGTGATRVSTLEQMCTGQTAQLKQIKDVLEQTPLGVKSFGLMQGTKMSQPETTEQVYQQMAEMAKCQDSDQIESLTEQFLDAMKELVVSDMEIIKENANRVNPHWNENKMVKGIYQPTQQEVSFSKVLFKGSVILTQEQIDTLLKGDTLVLQMKQKDKTYPFPVKLGNNTFKGKTYFGVIKDTEYVSPDKVQGIFKPTGKQVAFKKTYGTYVFNQEEIDALLDGQSITITMDGKYGQYQQRVKLDNFTFNNKVYFGVTRDESGQDDMYAKGIFAPTGKEVRFKKKWGDYVVNEEEIEQLLNGDTIIIQKENKQGNVVPMTIHLDNYTFNKKKIFGICLDFQDKKK